jgi:hypothetical protein
MDSETLASMSIPMRKRMVAEDWVVGVADVSRVAVAKSFFVEECE